MSRTAAGLLALLSLAPATPDAQEPRLVIGVDPRIELLSILQVLGTRTGQLGLLNSFDTPYRRDVLRQFAPFREHPAVTCVDSLVASGFSFDAPHHLMVHLTPPPELRPLGELPAEIVARARGGRERIDACLERMRAFAVEGGFDAFFAAHGEAYDAMAARARELADATDYVGQLESYFGERQATYAIVLAPLLAGNFGPRVRHVDGLHIYGIVSPFGVSEGAPLFSTEDRLRYLIWHEFGHSFVNPLAETRAAALDSTSSLLEPIRERMRRSGYSSWRTVVNEHIIRAVTARLEALHLGEERGAMAALREKTSGFAYIDSLTAALEDYEARRAQYPSFAAYYPELVAVFRRLSRQELRPDFFTYPFIGPMDAAGNDSSLLIVLPTAEPDDSAQTALHEYVRAMAARFFTQGTIVMDTIAMAMELSGHALIVYGTLAGKRLLARIADTRSLLAPRPSMPLMIHLPELSPKLAASPTPLPTMTITHGWRNQCRARRESSPASGSRMKPKRRRASIPASSRTPASPASSGTARLGSTCTAARRVRS